MAKFMGAKDIREQDTNYIDKLNDYFQVDIESSSDAVDFMLSLINEYEFDDPNYEGNLNIRKRK